MLVRAGVVSGNAAPRGGARRLRRVYLGIWVCIGLRFLVIPGMPNLWRGVLGEGGLFIHRLFDDNPLVTCHGKWHPLLLTFPLIVWRRRCGLQVPGSARHSAALLCLCGRLQVRLWVLGVSN